MLLTTMEPPESQKMYTSLNIYDCIQIFVFVGVQQCFESRGEFTHKAVEQSNQTT